MKTYLYELFSVLSRLLNVVLGGDADTTFSARLYITDKRLLVKFVDTLFYLVMKERFHCKDAWLTDVTRAKAQVAYHEKRFGNET